MPAGHQHHREAAVVICSLLVILAVYLGVYSFIWHSWFGNLDRNDTIEIYRVNNTSQELVDSESVQAESEYSNSTISPSTTSI